MAQSSHTARGYDTKYNVFHIMAQQWFLIQTLEFKHLI